MGKIRKGTLRFKFGGELMLEFHKAKISSDAGLLVYRELDEALGLTTDVENVIGDSRTGKKIFSNSSAINQLTTNAPSSPFR